MASAATVHKHAYQMEYLKEVSRIRVERMIRKLKVNDFFTSPKKVARDLTFATTNSLLGEIGDVTKESLHWLKLLGYKPIPLVRARAIAKEVTLEWQQEFEARALGVLQRIQRQIKKDIKNGLAEVSLRRALAQPSLKERLYQELIRTLRPQGASLMTEIAARLRSEALKKISGKLVWITTEGPNVCSDTFFTACEQRHGEERTAKEWAKVGMPGSSVLLCSSFGKAQCQCELVVAESKEEDILDRVDVTADMAAGKAAAHAQFEV